MRIKIVKEGKTEFYVLEGEEGKRGPGKRRGGFYNPSMELNRDISILLVQWLVGELKTLRILDGLAACGARGVRIANEVDGEFEVIINDWNKDAYKLIQKNVKGLENATATCLNINQLMHSERFDYIDIDPYGTPVPYIDAAVRSIKHKGVVAVTATDTATLYGVYPKTCRRRYFAVPSHSYIMREVGLRILIGYICREAAKYDRGIEVLFSHATDHYMRTYVRIFRGAKRADDSLNKVKVVDVTHEKIGPIWTGRLHDKEVLESMQRIIKDKILATRREIERLLEITLQEVDLPNFFYDTNILSSEMRVSPPKLSSMINAIERAGYRVGRTQFGSTSFKTTAPKDVVYNIFREIVVGNV